DGSGDGGRGNAPGLFAWLDRRDGRIDVAAVVAAGSTDPHGGGAAGRPVGGNRRASGGAAEGPAHRPGTASAGLLTWILAGLEGRYRDVWIVVAAFNEAAVIGEVIADVRSVFDHVVCVDDGSDDDTGAIALRAGAHLVRHPVNLGQGAAIQTGVEYARRQPGAEVFVTFDADGQHRVKDVLRMIDKLVAEDVDIVIGTRFAGQGVHNDVPVLKRIVLRTAVWLSPRSRRLKLSDAHNGLRVLNRRVADSLDITMSGMGHAS